MADFGELRDYILGAAVKRLCEVELGKQHELNGVASLKGLLGTPDKFKTEFIRLDDNEDAIESSKGFLTWYDSREGKPRSSEFRCYYTENSATDLASPGDPVVLIRKIDETIIFVTAPRGSQSESELFGLFGSEFGNSFRSLDFSSNPDFLGIGTRYVLQKIGVELRADYGADYLGKIEERFGRLEFPSTKEFSELARYLAGELEDYSTSDDAVVAWWDVEEAMFYQLEANEVTERLATGFGDVPAFLKYSTSIRQRRVVRAGLALENHIAFILDKRRIPYSWGKKTEKNKTPDFIFPSIEDYLEPGFPDEKLTMLGVKATCKDRWRQVLAEAVRVKEKHLFTLQPGISKNQTEEMIDAKLRLVVPTPIHSSYTKDQKNWLWNLEQFLALVSSKSVS